MSAPQIHESQVSQLVENARRDIEGRLNELERQIGRNVLGLSITSMEVTNVCDPSRKFARLVQIDVAPAPGRLGVVT